MIKLKNTANQLTEDYVFEYLKYNSDLKNDLYYGEIEPFKKTLNNIEWGSF
jgi:hypothetical protein